jgi:hypothetical protein
MSQFRDMRIVFRLNEGRRELALEIGRQRTIKDARSLDLADLGAAMLRPCGESGHDFGSRIREILLGCAENASKVGGEFA